MKDRLEQEKDSRMTKTPDEIGSYLKMIGRVPLLKEAEEVELGQQVKRMMVCLELKEKLKENSSEITDEESDFSRHLFSPTRSLDRFIPQG